MKIQILLKTPVNSVMNSKPSEWVCKQYRNDKTKFITGIAIASVALKDGFGCYLYVKQSLNNKNIPDEKRKFVAAMDLTNGSLMIAAQILAFLTICNKSVQSKLFGKKVDKLLEKAVKTGYKTIKKDTKNISQSAEKLLIEIKNGLKDAVGFISTLAISTILAKRVIVPFIATPLADFAEKKMKDKDRRLV